MVISTDFLILERNILGFRIYLIDIIAKPDFLAFNNFILNFVKYANNFKAYYFY